MLLLKKLRFEVYLKQGRRENINGLYVVNAQYRHTGMYECIAETVTLSISRIAMVTVKGKHMSLSRVK